MAKLLKRIILVVIICIIASTTGVYADESKPLGYEELSAQGTNSETDIDCSDWSKEEIIFATELGFLPDEFLSDFDSPITRAQFAKIALYFAAMQYRCDIYSFKYIYTDYMGIDEYDGTRSFSDCFDVYVHEAHVTNLVSGVGNGLFMPDRPITREESAQMLCNTYASYGNVQLSEMYTSNQSASFTDSDEISEWAKESIDWVVTNGVMQGVGDGRFAPKSYYTIEQCIATFVRLYRNAPISISHGGQPLFPYSPEETLNFLRMRFLFEEIQTIENDLYIVILGRWSGLPHGGTQLYFYVIYKNGGLFNLLPNFRSWSSISSIQFGEAPEILVVTGKPYNSYEYTSTTINLEKQHTNDCD